MIESSTTIKFEKPAAHCEQTAKTSTEPFKNKMRTLWQGLSQNIFETYRSTIKTLSKPSIQRLILIDVVAVLVLNEWNKYEKRSLQKQYTGSNDSIVEAMNYKFAHLLARLPYLPFLSEPPSNNRTPLAERMATKTAEFLKNGAISSISDLTSSQKTSLSNELGAIIGDWSEYSPA
jgi:hypothetical protein